MTCQFVCKPCFKHSHCEHWVYCDKPAVVRVPLGLSGQLTQLVYCLKHARWAEKKGGRVEALCDG